ncbi:MAG: hypothetical protein LBU39_02450 [Desulfobulbaceae bacterium]|jgi:hypothetical protein|nr:hypothetical protein [Desulfobulbaceae bacterium]
MAKQTRATELAGLSLSLYRQLADELRLLIPKVGVAEADLLLTMDTRMTQLRRAIENADGELASLLSKSDVGDGPSPELLRERHQAMAEALTLHHEAITQAEGVKSLLAHDLAAMRQGRQALHGYTPPPEDAPGGLINRQS